MLISPKISDKVFSYYFFRSTTSLIFSKQLAFEAKCFLKMKLCLPFITNQFLYTKLSL
jgi:hypothetical protein